MTAILLSRQTVQRAFGPEPGWNETVTTVLTVGGVFYGLLLGLIAAATYESYDAAQSRVADEAAAVGTLYHEVSACPEPYRDCCATTIVHAATIDQFARFDAKRLHHRAGPLNSGCDPNRRNMRPVTGDT
ncbi:hypothetical protein GCM10011610_62890 [Nocardia rhizosphaerihabitans]|uniref:Uncharacterized protein n=1 Tax=Nocardia rhizosphaerihabitans TaxID=1691570 RepID=A0ABQ2L0J2_9NOCA|nr:hypothetical protein [Nocardia rhizosphaerihabitans]GGN97150.1 hypothetical protein GCM10011610_62890 [Nocardia rhizosphaerihabitans]